MFVEYDDIAFPYPQEIGETASSISGLGPADESMIDIIFIMPNKSTNPDATLMIVVDEVTPETNPKTYQYVYVGNINDLPSDVLTEGSIVNDLTTGGTDKPLSAEQGRTLNSHVNYTTCESGAADQVKLISDNGFELSTHLRLLVMMTNTNTHATPKFNINNTGIKDVWYNGAVASDTNTWAAGEVLDVYYDGTKYVASKHVGISVSQNIETGLSSISVGNDSYGIVSDLFDKVKTLVGWGSDTSVLVNVGDMMYYLNEENPSVHKRILVKNEAGGVNVFTGNVSIFIYQNTLYYYNFDRDLIPYIKVVPNYLTGVIDIQFGDGTHYTIERAVFKLKGWGDDVSVLVNAGDKMYYLNEGNPANKKILVKTTDGINLMTDTSNCIFIYNNLLYYYDNNANELVLFVDATFKPLEQTNVITLNGQDKVTIKNRVIPLLGWGDDTSVLVNTGDAMYYLNEGHAANKKVIIRTSVGGSNLMTDTSNCIFIYNNLLYYYDVQAGELKSYSDARFINLVGWGSDTSVLVNTGDLMYYVNPDSPVNQKVLIKNSYGGINVYTGDTFDIYFYEGVYYIYYGGELVDMAPKTRERLIALENKVNMESLEGKKCLFLGDSLTFYGYYVDTLIDDLGIISYNRGNGSSTIATPISESDQPTHSFAERVDYARNDTQDARGTLTGMPSVAMDYVFIEGGINDFGRFCSGGIVTSFGSFIEDTTTTFCGALNYVIKKLRGYYPNAVICVIGLIPTNGNGGTFEAWSQYNTDGTIRETPENKSWFDYNEMLRKIANRYGCKFISLEELGYNPIISADKTTYYLDGLHPNQLGGAIMAKRIEIALRDIVKRNYI